MGLLKQSDYILPNDDHKVSPVQSEEPETSSILKKPTLNSTLTVTVPSITTTKPSVSPSEYEPDTQVESTSSSDVNLDRYDHNLYQSQDIVEPDGLPADEVERLEKEAYDKGYQAAKSELEGQISEKLAAFDDSIETLAVERDKILNESQEGILNLSIRIAEKMLGAQLSASRASLKTVLDEAFQKISSSDRVVIRANPEDVAFIRESSVEFEQKFSTVRSVTVEEDHSLDVGSCILETDYGFVDARLPMKISIIEDAFKKVRLTQEND